MSSFFLFIFRQSLRYRWTVAGSLGCSLMVGILWGANIGTMFPLVKIVFDGDSLNASLTRQIAESGEQIEELKKNIVQFERQVIDVKGAELSNAQQGLAGSQTRLEAEQIALTNMRRWKPWVVRYLPQGPFQTMLVVVGIVLIGSILRGLFLAWNEILLAKIVNRTLLDLRRQLFRKLLHMDLAMFENERSSKLMTRFTNDLAQLGAGISAALGQAVREPLKVICCLIGAAFISWQLLLVSLIVMPGGLFFVHWLTRRVNSSGHDNMVAVSELNARLAESFRGIMTVKTFTMERHERRKFGKTSKCLYKKRLQISRLRAYIKPLAEVIGITVVAMGLLSGAYLVVNHETHLFGVMMSSHPISPPQLFVFYAFLMGITDPVRKLSGLSIIISRSSAAAERLEKIMQRSPNVVNPNRPIQLVGPIGRLSYSDVHYQYQEGTPVLKGVSLTIEPGECVAIVGPNGCGKTTLAKLTPRLFDPIQGTVSIGGIDLRRFSVRELRQRIGVVTQMPYLFDDTVANNIRAGMAEITDEQVEFAAIQTGSHEFIRHRLSDGYQTIVGEGGNKLSGGQAQRIVLARTILRNPDILILDEPTSQIDVDAEREILRMLTSFMKTRTTILITHRVSMLQLADRIVVMAGGEFLDIGNHNELLSRCPEYQRLQERSKTQAA